MNDSRVYGICMVNGNIVAENGPVRSAMADASTDKSGESEYVFFLKNGAITCLGLDSNKMLEIPVGALRALAVACDSATWTTLTSHVYRNTCPKDSWRQWARKTRRELDI